MKYALQIALAILFVVFLGHWVGIEKVYWVIIACMMVMLPTVGATLERSKKRAIATLFGVLFGGVLAMMVGHVFWLSMLIILIFLFFACYYIASDYSKAMFCISALMILFLGYLKQDVWHFAYLRFLDTLIGVIIGFVFSCFIFPSWSKRNVNQTLHSVISGLKELSFLVIQITPDDERNTRVETVRAELIKQTEKLKKEAGEMRHEMDLLDHRLLIIDAIVLIVERLRFDLYLVNDMPQSGVIQEKLESLGVYTQEVYSRLLDCCERQKPMPSIKAHDYEVVSSPYTTQAMRTYVSDLVALQQDVTYFYNR